MKTTGVSSIPKFGLLGFLGHSIGDTLNETCNAFEDMQDKPRNQIFMRLKTILGKLKRLSS